MAELERGLVRARGAGYEWQLGHPFTEVRCAAEGCGKRVGWLPEADARACPKCGGAVARSVARRMLSSGGHASERAAREALEDKRRELRGGTYVHERRQTVSGYLTAWVGLRGDRVRPTTAASYAWLVDAYVVPHVGALQLTDLSTERLERLYADLLAGGGRGGKPLSVRTVRYVHTVLRKALQDAVRKRVLTANPAAVADVPTSRPGEWAEDDDAARALQAWDVEQLRVWARHVDGQRLRALWLLLPLTGLRRGEALGLRWSDLSDGELRVRRNLVLVSGRAQFGRPKTAESRREFALDREVQGILRQHRKEQAAERLAWGEAYADEDLVFCRENGAALDPGGVSKEFRKLAAAAGLPPIPLHGLRHTFASVAFGEGVEVLV